MNKLILLGAPGAGKGTAASVISEKLSIPHISTGDIFRKAVKEQTPLGKEVEAITSRGDLVSDRLTADLVKDRLAADDVKNGYILDGFPRNTDQAEMLSGFASIDRVILFDLSDKEIVERLGGRRGCPDCGAGYHVKFIPPKTEGICDQCGAQLQQRKDDRPEAIEKRLELYRSVTAPLIGYYEERGQLTKIDASPAPEKVVETLISEL